MYKNNKQGFSLVELIVVIAIIGILVMLAYPRFLARTKEATLAKHLYNVKTLEDTMDRYFLENNRFARLSEEAYTSEQVEEYASRIRDITGEEITLDPEGKYYDIDYVTLKDYVKIPDKRDMPNYILQNPVGKVFFLERLTEIANVRADFTTSNPLAGKKDDVTVASKGYTNKKIQTLIDKEYIPISNSADINSIRSNTERIFGAGTQWEKMYTGGLDKNYIQVSDIDLSDIDNFEPIGGTANAAHAFKGIYNGGNFKIQNLRISMKTKSYIGLFGNINNSTIQNIELANVNIEGKDLVAGLVGGASVSTVSNCSVTGVIIGENSVGGLVGRSSNSIINNSHAMKGTQVKGHQSVGGLVGMNHNYSTINKSSSSVNIVGYGQLGGLVGHNTNAEVNKSYATGDVHGDKSSVGGLVGLTENGAKVNNSYATGKTSGFSYIGGLIGRKLSGVTTNSYSTGSVVTDSSWKGGLIGYNLANQTVSNSYFDKETSGQTRSDGGMSLTTEEMQKESSYSNWDFDTIWQISPGEYPTLQWEN